jgi:hypothetical protein
VNSWFAGYMLADQYALAGGLLFCASTLVADGFIVLSVNQAVKRQLKKWKLNRGFSF